MKVAAKMQGPYQKGHRILLALQGKSLPIQDSVGIAIAGNKNVVNF
jgi:hypothetical protein